MNTAVPLRDAGRAEDAGARVARVVLLVVGLLTLLRLVYALFLGPAPQETYYWEYARHLDLSYLDHPPLSAWSIALSTALFGSTPFALHLPAVIAGAALSWLLYRLGARLYGPEVGAVAALGANATVLFGIGAVVITPDVPLLLFWTWTLLVFVELVLPDGRGRAGHWYAVGALAGLALLGKYTAALLPAQILVTSLLLPRGRRWLRTPHPWLALLVTIVVFSPVLVWNVQHGLASFAFQTTRRASQVTGFHLYLVGRYLGLQATAVTPLLYLGLWWAAWRLLRGALRGRPNETVLAVASLPGLALFTLVSPFHWVKMNWVAPAYVGLLVGVAALWWTGRTRRALRAAGFAAVGLAILLTSATYAMPFASWIPFPEKQNLFSGWNSLSAAVDARLAQGEARRPFVVGWDYKTASELAFHLPGQPRTASAEAFGGNGLNYGLWLDAAAHEGRDALVVSDRRHAMRDAASRLPRYCASVEPLAPVTVTRGAKTVSTFDLWWCRAWHPRAPRP